MKQNHRSFLFSWRSDVLPAVSSFSVNKLFNSLIIFFCSERPLKMYYMFVYLKVFCIQPSLRRIFLPVQNDIWPISVL